MKSSGLDEEELKRPRLSHIWRRERNEHYVEPEWCSKRLFDVEDFRPGIWDPCCGFGRIPQAALAAGLRLFHASDLVFRGYGAIRDFLEEKSSRGPNIVCNPPFELVPEFLDKAMSFPETSKVAMIFPTARLNAARWLQNTPLSRIWLLTPRPSMPPGHTITAGEKPGGGKMDFCWLVWEYGYLGENAEIGWLHRDGYTAS